MDLLGHPFRAKVDGFVPPTQHVNLGIVSQAQAPLGSQAFHCAAQVRYQAQREHLETPLLGAEETPWISASRRRGNTLNLRFQAQRKHLESPLLGEEETPWISASRRRGNTLEVLKDLYLKVKARI